MMEIFNTYHLPNKNKRKIWYKALIFKWKESYFWKFMCQKLENCIKYSNSNKSLALL